MLENGFITLERKICTWRWFREPNTLVVFLYLILQANYEPHDFECEYSTMGGWAIERLDADPHVGDSFTDEDDTHTLYVVVSEMDDMRVTKLTVLVKTRETDEDE